jgi:hypothetical protein
MYSHLKKTEIIIDDQYDAGEIVGFKRFFPKKSGKIISASMQRSKHYIVDVDGTLHQVYFLDMYLMPLERKVLFEKYKNWRRD